MDDWPLFVRIDQNTGIQREIAGRLGRIYAEAGFRFVYFDGAEDVPMPYWYNVSRSQSVAMMRCGLRRFSPKERSSRILDGIFFRAAMPSTSSLRSISVRR